jgi:hypothetical protein
MVWFLVFVFAHDWILRIHGKWFRLSREQFDALHYAGTPPAPPALGLCSSRASSLFSKRTTAGAEIQAALASVHRVSTSQGRCKQTEPPSQI